MNETAYILVRGSLILLCLSAMGPFALGPLVASGLKNTPYYQDAIYFYLHFQMNGFMLLAVLGLLAAAFPVKPLKRRSREWLHLFVFSAVPLYFIFALWNKPGNGVWILACIGAGLNLISWLALCYNFKSLWRDFTFIEKAAFIGMTFKCVFQVAVCVPAIGDWTFLNRNLIIGYIHLLTLGIIMPLLIGQFVRKGIIRYRKIITNVNTLYLILVVTYLCLLFMQPLLSLFSILIPSYQFLLLLLCFSFLPVGVLLLLNVKNNINIRM